MGMQGPDCIKFLSHILFFYNSSLLLEMKNIFQPALGYMQSP